MSARPMHQPTLSSRRRILQALAAAGVVSAIQPRTVAAQEATDRMVAQIFFDSNSIAALRQALRYAADSGFVASLPQLLHARVNASYDNIIWNTWFTANSEESVVRTARGNLVVVTAHGGGIYATPERLERSLRADLNRHNPEGLTGQYAGKITATEARDLLEGKLPSGEEIPIYPYREFRDGIAALPMRYGVILDFGLAKGSTSGYEQFDVLKGNPLMIVRAGGAQPAATYLDKAAARHGTERMGHLHPFNRIDPNQPQTRLLNLGGNRGGTNSEGKDEGLGWGYDEDWGISGNNGLVDMARYVAVALRDPSTSLQHVDFDL